MSNLTVRLGRKGQGLVEYVLAVVLMALLAVGAIRYLGKKTHNAFVTAGDTLENQMQYSQRHGNSQTLLQDGN